MKLIHLSDLHLGKRLNEFSMLEEQDAILKQILEIIDLEAPNGVILAGDIYDKSIPPADAVQLFDEFLCELARRNLQVFIISGNHDSPERIAFGSRIMDASGIHLSPVYDGSVTPITVSDGEISVNIYMLPFVKPSHVRRFFADEEITSYTDALRVAISNMNIDASGINILVTHQFITDATTCDSEERSVGGSDNVDASVFDGFDYVALGHIHGAQNCGSERIRYCGTPLKYSFSEIEHEKSVTVVEFSAKDSLSVREVPLTPLHDMSEIRGSFAELTDPVYYTNNSITENYLRVILTDEDDVPNAISRLRSVYKNLMAVKYDNQRTRSVNTVSAADSENKSAYELFSDFFKLQNNTDMSAEQSEYMQKLIEEIEEEMI